MSEKTVKIDSCIICGNDTFKKRFSCKDHYATKKEFDLYSCEKCDFTFTQDFPNEGYIDRYYISDQYISHTDSRRNLMEHIYHYVRRYMLRKKRELIEKQNKIESRRLLDIGAGTGYFLKEMKNAGWFVSGIEKNENAKQVAKEKFGVNLNDFNHIYSIENESFGVVTLWHVLEHLQHIDDTLKQISRILERDGIIVIAVPNRISFDANYYKANWAAYDVPRHLWHFAPKDIKQLLDKIGFECIEANPMYFDAFYVSILTEKNLGRKLAFMKGCVVGLCGFIKSLFNKEKSSSIIYVFRRSNKTN